MTPRFYTESSLSHTAAASMVGPRRCQHRSKRVESFWCTDGRNRFLSSILFQQGHFESKIFEVKFLVWSPLPDRHNILWEGPRLEAYTNDSRNQTKPLSRFSRLKNCMPNRPRYHTVKDCLIRCIHHINLHFPSTLKTNQWLEPHFRRDSRPSHYP